MTTSQQEEAGLTNLAVPEGAQHGARGSRSRSGSREHQPDACSAVAAVTGLRARGGVQPALVGCAVAVSFLQQKLISTRVTIPFSQQRMRTERVSANVQPYNA